MPEPSDAAPPAPPADSAAPAAPEPGPDVTPPPPASEGSTAPPPPTSGADAASSDDGPVRPAPGGDVASSEVPRPTAGSTGPSAGFDGRSALSAPSPDTAAATPAGALSAEAEGCGGTVAVGSDGLPVPDVAVPVARRGRRRLLVGVGAGVVVLAVVVGLVGVPLYRKVFAASPTERVLSAAQRLAAAPEVRYRGGTGGTDDNLVVLGVDVRIGAKGTAVGRVTRPAGSADLVRAGSRLYLRGDKGWLLATDPMSSGYRSGHWISATDDDLGVDLARLTPRRLAARIRSGLRAGAVTAAHTAVDVRAHRPSTVDGHAVVPYRVPSGDVVYVSADEPYAVLGVEGRLGATDDGYLSLDVTPGDRAAATNLRHDLADRTGNLDADADPTPPARYSMKKDSFAVGRCDDHECEVSMRVFIANYGDTSRPGAMVLVLSGDVNSNHLLGDCVATMPRLTIGQTGTARCTVRTAEWRRWSAAGGPRVWCHAVPFSPGWQGRSPEPLRAMYSRPGVPKALHESATLDISVPVESIELLNGLLGAGWSAADAISATEAVNHANALGPVGALVGHHALSADPAAFGATFTEGQRPYYAEAARRVAAGSTTVAVRNWASGGATYQGDVFDVSRHRVVWLAPLDGTGSAAAALGSALGTDRAAPVPHGFDRELRMVVGPHSTWYRMGRSELLAELRADGLRAGTLRGIRDLVFVNARGATTVHPGDLR